MRYNEFEDTISPERMQRYVLACGNDTRRNRIAHHEAICFGNPVCIDTQGVLDCYARIMRLFHWMNINANTLLYGLDHVGQVSSRIMCI